MKNSTETHNETIATKVTGIFTIRAVKSTLSCGRVRFGVSVTKDGTRQGEVAWGYNEGQARRIVDQHEAASHAPDILYYYG